MVCNRNGLPIGQRIVLPDRDKGVTKSTLTRTSPGIASCLLSLTAGPNRGR